MGKFASGKRAYFISDRSGQRYPYRDARREWTGAIVGPDEFEPKHPQLYPVRNLSEPQALRDARPDRTEPAVQQLLRKNAFSSSVIAGSSVITVTEINHGRTTGDRVRFRKVNGFNGFSSSNLSAASGYIINVVDSDTYTFSAGLETSINGNTNGDQRGGGENATVEEESETSVATMGVVFTVSVAAVTTTSVTTFDSSSITLDSSTKTFDEG